MPGSLRPSSAIALGCMALALAGCGGADAPSWSEASTAVVEQADALCAAWSVEVEERGPFPLEDFDAERPSPDDLPIVGEYFAAGHAAREEMIAAIAALSAPPEIRAPFDALVGALERGQAVAREQAAAARAGDRDAFVATLDEADASQQAIAAAADALGAGSCSA